MPGVWKRSPKGLPSLISGSRTVDGQAKLLFPAAMSVKDFLNVR